MNPTLTKLGFSPNDRVVIIHADDIGMCQASISAFAELWEAGAISSAAMMVPCSWFPHAAAYCRAHPDVDMGIHITLTSEWDTYRWGPISTRDPASGLMDEEGYFPRNNGPVHAYADPAAAQREMQAQVERALAAGLLPTHVDTHMGTVVHPKLLSAYAQLAFTYHLPVFTLRLNEAEWRGMGLDAEAAQVAVRAIQALEDSGLPMIDHMSGMPLDVKEDHAVVARRVFAELPAGLTHFVLHPSHDTLELRAIAPDWRGRVANLQTFLREDLRTYLKQIGVHVIGYRALKELMPQH